jgi:hypothetical protein
MCACVYLITEPTSARTAIITTNNRPTNNRPTNTTDTITLTLTLNTHTP